MIFRGVLIRGILVVNQTEVGANFRFHIFYNYNRFVWFVDNIVAIADQI